MRCACGQHKTPQACAGARHFRAHPEIWQASKPRPPRVRLSKPCARGGCTGEIVAHGPKTLGHRMFCSHRCAYLERVRLEGKTWFHRLTTAERRRGAVKAGRIVGERNHRRALVAASNRALALLPKDLLEMLTALQLARLRVAIGRTWLEGKQAGYSASAYQRRKGAA